MNEKSKKSIIKRKLKWKGITDNLKAKVDFRDFD